MMTTAVVLHRSSIVMSRAASCSRRLFSIQQIQQRSSFPAALTSSSFSSSPDYTNYETWHDHRFDDHHLDIMKRQQYYVNGGHGSHAVINMAGSVNDNNSNNSPLEGPRTSVLMELNDRVGALHDVLKY